MQRLEVSGAVRLIYRSLGVKGLIFIFLDSKMGHNMKIKIKDEVSKIIFLQFRAV